MFSLLSFIALSLCPLTIDVHAHQAIQREANLVRVKAHVAKQEYCRGTYTAFSVLLDVNLEIENTSKTPVQVLWPMVPWVGKVASSVDDAEAGRFLFEQSTTYYPPEAGVHFELLNVRPGKAVSREVSYYLIARQNAASSFFKSVSPGTYALILVLSPDDKPPSHMKGPDTLKRLTTEPFLVEVPADAKIVKCDAVRRKQ